MPESHPTRARVTRKFAIGRIRNLRVGRTGDPDPGIRLVLIGETAEIRCTLTTDASGWLAEALVQTLVELDREGLL